MTCLFSFDSAELLGVIVFLWLKPLGNTVPLVFGNWEINEQKTKAAPEVEMYDLGKILWRSRGLGRIKLWGGETTSFSRVV